MLQIYVLLYDKKLQTLPTFWHLIEQEILFFHQMYIHIDLSPNSIIFCINSKSHTVKYTLEKIIIYRGDLQKFILLQNIGLYTQISPISIFMQSTNQSISKRIYQYNIQSSTLIIWTQSLSFVTKQVVLSKFKTILTFFFFLHIKHASPLFPRRRWNKVNLESLILHFCLSEWLESLIYRYCLLGLPAMLEEIVEVICSGLKKRGWSGYSVKSSGHKIW